MLAMVWDNATQKVTVKPMPDNIFTRLHSAICISLFTDARCTLEELPSGESDQRGWWGDMALPEGESLGSKLYLLKRRKLTGETINMAMDYAGQSVQWLLGTEWVQAIRVNAERVGINLLAFRVEYKLSAEQPWQQLILEWKTNAV